MRIKKKDVRPQFNAYNRTKFKKNFTVHGPLSELHDKRVYWQLSEINLFVRLSFADR